MSEINGPKFSVNQVNYQNIQKPFQETVPESLSEESPKINDFSNPQAEVIGRSMLIKDTDNINHDLQALLEKPQIAENSDKAFETAFKAAQAAGIEHPYEEAASFATSELG